jgi:hypothetical protein
MFYWFLRFIVGEKYPKVENAPVHPLIRVMATTFIGSFILGVILVLGVPLLTYLGKKYIDPDLVLLTDNHYTFANGTLALFAHVFSYGVWALLLEESKLAILRDMVVGVSQSIANRGNLTTQIKDKNIPQSKITVGKDGFVEESHEVTQS